MPVLSSVRVAFLTSDCLLANQNVDVPSTFVLTAIVEPNGNLEIKAHADSMLWSDVLVTALSGADLAV